MGSMRSSLRPPAPVTACALKWLARLHRPAGDEHGRDVQPHGLGERGKKTLLIDLDPQVNWTTAFDMLAILPLPCSKC